MAGQQILDLLIGVRVPAGQPFDSSLCVSLMAIALEEANVLSERSESKESHNGLLRLLS